MTPEERRGVQRGLADEALRGRLDLRQLAEGVRRQGPRRPCRTWCWPRSSPGPRRRCGPTSSATRSSARRSCSGGPRSRRRSSCRKILQGEIALVPGLQRARLAAPTWPPQDHGRARRRRVGDQRPEGLDHPGPVRRLLLPARPHRPGRAEAQRASRTCSCRCSSPASRCAPITQPDGTAEFNEVFFADARCPKDNVVGGVNNGWEVANTTLGFERGMSATTGYRRFEEELDQIMVEAARRTGAIDDPLIRQRLAGATTRRSRSCGSTACARLTADAARAARTSASPRSARPTRCSGPRCTATRWSWRSTSSAPTRMLVDGRPDDGLVARQRMRHRGRDGYPVSPMDVGVLLLPVRDDLGRHGRDPAQHRRRAGARPAAGAEGGRQDLMGRRSAPPGARKHRLWSAATRADRSASGERRGRSVYLQRQMSD